MHAIRKPGRRAPATSGTARVPVAAAALALALLRPGPDLLAPTQQVEVRIASVVSAGAELLTRAPAPDPRELEEILPAPAEVRSRALPLVRKFAQHPTAALRAEAVLALGCLGDRDEIPLLRSMLEDSSPAVAERAILGLGLLGDSAVASLLAKLGTSEESSARERSLALLALGLLERDAGIPSVIERLSKLATRSHQRHQEEILAGLTALGLSRSGAGRGLLESLLANAAFRDKELRSAAITALARTAGGAAEAVLVAALDEKTAEARSAAALGLARSERSPAAEKELRRVAEKDPDLAVRAAALVALAVRRDQSSLELSLRTFTSGPAELRGAAALQMAGAGGELERHVLRSGLSRSLPAQSRAAILIGIAMLGDLGSAGMMRELLVAGGEPTEVRIAAAKALALLRHTESLKTLREEFARTEDPGLLRALAVAARSLSPTEGIAMDPPPPAKDRDRTSVPAKLRALGNAGSRGLLGTTLSLLGSTVHPVSVRIAALAALRDHADPGHRIRALADALPREGELLGDVRAWLDPTLPSR